VQAEPDLSSLLCGRLNDTNEMMMMMMMTNKYTVSTDFIYPHYSNKYYGTTQIEHSKEKL